MLKYLIVEGPPGCLSSWQCSQAWLQVFGLLQMLLSSYGRRGSMRLSLLILQAMPGKTENAAKPRFRASARHGVSRHGRMWEEWCSACSPQRGNLRKRRECEIEEGRTDFWVGQEIQGEWHWSKADKRRVYRYSTEVECMCHSSSNEVHYASKPAPEGFNWPRQTSLSTLQKQTKIQPHLLHLPQGLPWVCKSCL